LKPDRVAVSRKYNIGAYQTIDYHVEAILDERENPRQALKELELMIIDYWDGRNEALMSRAHRRT